MSNKKAPKVKPPIITSREGLENVVASITEVQIELAGLQGKIIKRTAEAEQKLADSLREERARVDLLTRDLNALMTGAQVFCQNRREELMPDDKVKHFETTTAVVGFELSPPKVDKRNSDDTFEAIALRLQALEWGDTYVKEPPPVMNKEALLRDRANLTDAQQVAAGIKFAQAESFYVTPKSQVAEKESVPAAA